MESGVFDTIGPVWSPSVSLTLRHCCRSLDVELPNLVGAKSLIFQSAGGTTAAYVGCDLLMPSAPVLGLQRLRSVLLENLALLQQLVNFKGESMLTMVARRDRCFWLLLFRVWKGWRRAVMIAHPDTVLRWHQERIRTYWERFFIGRNPGRPWTDIEMPVLIRRSTFRMRWDMGVSAVRRSHCRLSIIYPLPDLISRQSNFGE